MSKLPKLNKPIINPYVYAGLVNGERVLKDETYLLQQVCKFFGIAEDELKCNSRERKYCLPRHVYAKLLRMYTDLPLKIIGKEMGNRDHSSAINAITSIENMIDTDKRFNVKFNNLLAKL